MSGAQHLNSVSRWEENAVFSVVLLWVSVFSFSVDSEIFPCLKALDSRFLFSMLSFWMTSCTAGDKCFGTSLGTLLK